MQETENDRIFQDKVQSEPDQEFLDAQSDPYRWILFLGEYDKCESRYKII